MSHSALCSSAALSVNSYNWRSSDILLSLGDFHTMGGLRNPCLSSVYAGCSVNITSIKNRSNALIIADYIKNNKITLLSLVPAILKQFIHFANRIDPEALSSLRQVFCAGSTLSLKVSSMFLKHFGVPVFNIYGLTETTGICAGISPKEITKVQGSIGKPLESNFIIVKEDGLEAKNNEIGELFIFNERLMLRYIDSPEQTKQAFKGDFYKTGDLAYKDEDGFIFIIGRKGDAIKNYKGEFLHPSTIEEVLENTDLVSEAGVCRIIDKLEEEKLIAFIIPTKKVKNEKSFFLELLTISQEQLGKHRLPSEFFLIQSLPRGNNGKLLHNKLKELFYEKSK